MSESMTTTPDDTADATTAPTDAAPAKTYSQDEVERIVKTRLAQMAKKAKPSPEAEDAVRERDELKARLDALEDEKRSDIEKAQRRAQKAEEERVRVEAAAKADADAARAELRRYKLHSEINAVLADLTKGRGATQIPKLVEGLFAEDKATGAFVCEDDDTGKPLSVRDRLAAWLREPGNEIYLPPPPPGSGGRTGAASVAHDPAKSSGAKIREGFRELFPGRAG